ncbi:MAG TPA: copper oxidase [Candidatus Baltobacteraceae bacterium]|nr:copper oxidase [Candidatus Baltobacteraceae bacterium]
MNHGHDGTERLRVSKPEIFAMALLSVMTLAAGVFIAFMYGSFMMRYPEQGGTYMPPGMIVEHNVTTEQMTDMQAVDDRAISYSAPRDAAGDRPLEPTIENGVKVFHLSTGIVRWWILPNVSVLAYAYNNQVPGPQIRVRQGDRLRIIVHNGLPEPTSIHWHGLIVPNGMDGAAGITQPAIAPGRDFTYEFVAKQSGTYFYHSHDNPDRQQNLGLYGALIVEPPEAPDYHADKEVDVQLGEWLERNGKTFPAMPMEGTMPNYFTINGKAYPSTPVIRLKLGQKLLVRFIGTNSSFVHPMHIHGGPFEVVAQDGNTLPKSQRYWKDTVLIAPGERYDVIWPARERGRWLLHCHINHHITNDGVEENGAGGLTQIIDVR